MGIKLTGISTPIGGVSWNISATAKRGIIELFNYLEIMRLLTNPIEMEIPDECTSSAIAIKNHLVDLISRYDFNEETTLCIKTMCTACNSLLNGLQSKEPQNIIYKNSSGDWCDIGFSKIMKDFRKIFRENIKLLSEKYKVPFKKDIPEKY